MVHRSERWVASLNKHGIVGATLDDLREGVTTLEDAGRVARRVFGGAHPLTTDIECVLQRVRAALRACNFDERIIRHN